MMPVTSCHGLEITTIEGLGNRKKGYHPLQKTLAEDHGSQCGYCSPGLVMSMFSLVKTNPNITMLEIEKSLGSNVCRCTGFRPILEAFRKFAKDAPKQITLPDIEDLHICKKTGEECDKSNCEEREWCFVDKEECDKSNCEESEWCFVDKEDIIEIKLKDGRLWVRVQEVRDIFKIFDREGDSSYMLIHGNTGKGVFPIDEYPRLLIDISGVQELKGYVLDQNLIIKAGTTLTEFLEILKTVAKSEYFGYLDKIHAHILKVAHIPVRNVASIAGNLMLKNQNNSFSSDVFLLLETVMPRSQSAHALINAGFLYKMKSATSNVVHTARIVFGALSPSFVRATVTEEFLIGKKLFTNETLKSALEKLEKELVVVENPPEPSVEYRKKVALGLFYKGLLQLAPANVVDGRYRSGAINLHDSRPVSRAVQTFETNQTIWPVNQPIMQVDALLKTSGEAFFVDDLPKYLNEVFCALALSTVAVGDIVSIDASKALEYPGVIAFYTAKDIPGINSFILPLNFVFISSEEVFSSGSIQYYNQPIGVIVAETRAIAERAAKLVQATYKNIKDPVVDIKEAKNNPERTTLFAELNATDEGENVEEVIKGSNTIYGQYHFSTETLTTVIKPSEHGLDVYTSTHWTEGIQIMIAKALKMDQNR
ncbi:xanthine dehydrogenase-like [Trichoplusia ni]|uniref:Xanthine dehydrogenase-like n=1 Tax=Trichoplusia ni TaxID=7111 RepID=A0A7E5WMG9_TRINI|nr:xanthine dehydrogenase-like [Trichoplusia ni]